MIKESISIDTAINILNNRQEKLDILQRHTAQRIATLAARDRQDVFNHLRKKVKEAAKAVSETPLSGEIAKDIGDVRAVRQEAEALFGKFQEEEKEQAKLNSSQLNFLVGVQINATPSPHTVKQVQGTVIPVPEDAEEPLVL